MRGTYLLASLTALVLVGGATLQAAKQPQCSLTRSDMRLRRSIARALPAAYRHFPEWLTIGGDSTPRGSLYTVCSEPYPAPPATHTPPYVRLFLVSVRDHQARLRWSQALPPDNFCKALSLLRTKDRGALFSVIGSPYGGSVTRYHLRLYRYGKDHRSLECLLQTGFTDGSCAPLQGAGAVPLAFLVCAPEEKGLSKWRGTIYSPIADGHYHTKSRLVTLGSYDSRQNSSLQSAYRELRSRFQKRLGPIYRWPRSLPDLD